MESETETTKGIVELWDELLIFVLDAVDYELIWEAWLAVVLEVELKVLPFCWLKSTVINCWLSVLDVGIIMEEVWVSGVWVTGFCTTKGIVGVGPVEIKMDLALFYVEDVLCVDGFVVEEELLVGDVRVAVLVKVIVWVVVADGIYCIIPNGIKGVPGVKLRLFEDPVDVWVFVVEPVTSVF